MIRSQKKYVRLFPCIRVFTDTAGRHDMSLPMPTLAHLQMATEHAQKTVLQRSMVPGPSDAVPLLPRPTQLEQTEPSGDSAQCQSDSDTVPSRDPSASGVSGGAGELPTSMDDIKGYLMKTLAAYRAFEGEISEGADIRRCSEGDACMAV